MNPAQVVLPVLDTMLRNLQHFLSRAAADAQARGYDTAVLMQSRLAPDMLPLAGQIRYACISAKGGAAKLAGVPVPAYDPDDDTTLTAAQARIDTALAWLAALPQDGLDASATRELSVKVAPDRSHSFDAAAFARHWVMSHFHFHIAMAYALLRHNGVPLGKADYVWGAATPGL